MSKRTRDDRVAPQPAKAFNGVKVFTATSWPRSELGVRINEWFSANPQFRPVDLVVRQSSDDRFHCFTIVAFYRDRSTR